MLPKKVYQYVVSHIQSGAYNLSGRELFLACPECGDDSHFSVNLSNGKYNCFRCPTGGRLASEIVNNRLQWKKLTQNLLPKDLLGTKSRDKIVLPKNAYNIYRILYPNQSEPTRKHVANSLSLCGRAFKYCVNRGLTRKQIKEYRVYVCPTDPRVYFPYWNKQGEIIYYMGRKMMGDQDLVKTRDSENAEKPLFGRQVEVLREVAVLVEGVFDHFVTPRSYALMGSSINAEQMMQLREDGVKTVFVVGDPDASATVNRMASKLMSFSFRAFPVFMHLEGDPGDLGRKVMMSVVDELMSKAGMLQQPIHITRV